jgi:hypothetical protein
MYVFESNVNPERDNWKDQFLVNNFCWAFSSAESSSWILKFWDKKVRFWFTDFLLCCSTRPENQFSFCTLENRAQKHDLFFQFSSSRFACYRSTVDWCTHNTKFLFPQLSFFFLPSILSFHVIFGIFLWHNFRDVCVIFFPLFLKIMLCLSVKLGVCEYLQELDLKQMCQMVSV